MIEIKNLKKTYQMPGGVQVKALDGINLSIKKGEFVAIMGSSGSGKSTLLHMIGGVDMPTSGCIKIENQDIHKLNASEQALFRRRKVGMIYQAFNLIPTLTVEENMVLPMMLDKKMPRKETLDKMLELLQLKDRRRHLPGQLSGGQQQRTAIGRILLSQPAVLLADEPTGNLDSQNTKQVLKILYVANKSFGQTVVLVTHDPQVGKIAKRRILMMDGQIKSDEFQDILQKPVGMG